MTRRTETKKLRMVDMGTDEKGEPYVRMLAKAKPPFPLQPYEFERDGNRVIIMVSVGQIINEDKAYKRWKKLNGIV